MTALNIVAAQLMRHLCEHNWHGYTWDDRWGDGEGVCAVPVGGRAYELAQGDRDCSSAVIDCWRRALDGTDQEGTLDGATYTGNMRSVFTRSGLFEWKPMSFVAQVGDIYLNEANHTAMCVSVAPDLLGEFSINEHGGCYGGTVGDQTGRESSINGYYDYPWDGILHYIGGDASAPESAPTLPRYRARTAEDGWLPWMSGLESSDGSGEDFAGEMGHAIVDFDWEGPGWFQLTLADGTELPRNAHADSPLSGITLFYETPAPASTGLLAARYRVGVLGGSWLKWESDDDDGGAGGAGVIDRVQLTLERV